MGSEFDASFWQRFSKATGVLGGIAILLVIFAARVGGGFDWRVFFLAGLAVLLCWAQSVMLVPHHLRNEAAAEQEWIRFGEGDWRFVDIVSGLSGSEIDALRALFAAGDTLGVRAFLKEQAAMLDEDEVTAFIRFFNDGWTIEVASYVDETGAIRTID